MASRISVVTPTYERGATLPRLYESLVAQGPIDFEWVVVDDGSTDGTAELLEGWRQRAPFPVRVVSQENQGKHAALNRGVEAATGEFCAVMDSDDWYAPEALGRMLAVWESIPAEQRPGFASVEGLCADPEGATIGDRYPEDVFDSNTVEIGWRFRVEGDKLGMYRRELLLAFPYPEDLGWHVTPATVWNRIAARYQSRFVNEVWGFKEYLGEGLTGRETELRLRFPRAQLVYWDELLGIGRQLPRAVRFRAAANRVRYALLCDQGAVGAVSGASRRGWALLALPAGLVLHLRDRRAASSLGVEVGR